MNSVITFVTSMILYSCPLLFASVGVLMLEITGIVNMAAEGMLLIGAYTAVVAANHFGSIWMGALCAMIAAGAFGTVFTILVQEFRINQTVLGIAFNMIGAGLTTTLNRAFKTDGITIRDSFPKVLGFPLPVYIGVALIVLMWVFMYKTNLGVQFRAVGERPRVVESMGISVKKVRYMAGIVSSMIIGFGGAFLSTGLLSKFNENMASGRGFFALAAVTFGNYTPVGTLLGSLIFGAGETLSFRLQARGGIIPYEVSLMLPYLLIVIFLCIFSRNVRDPESLGIPYKKSS